MAEQGIEFSAGELPIMKYRDEIVEKVRENAVCIIFGGDTGCGKSTKIPQFIMDDCKKENLKILITQPRKIAAMTLAKRVANEQNCELGKTIGYQIGLSKKYDKENHETKVLFCTTGVVLEKIIYEKGIERYSHIILDEIHERDVDTDLLMMIIREYLLLGNANTKLILMSATLNINQFKNYFTLRFGENGYRPGIVAIHSERKFSIDIGYLDGLEGFRMSNKIINYSIPSITNELYHVAAKIVSVHLQESTNSILVFLPGIYEIECANSIFLNYETIKDKCIIVILHSSLPTDQQKDAFVRSALPKVILSTNIAESSVTIPNVDCVIDFCLTKNIVCEGSAIAGLKLEFASRNSCIQRAGRTGRVCNGKVYRLIHNRYYQHSLLQENIPEMQRAPLENVILRTKLLDFEAPVPFLSKCMSAPHRNSVIETILKLKGLGGIRLLSKSDIFYSDDGELTYVGKMMANLPIDVRLTKLIIIGYMFSVLEEAIIVAAGLNIKSIFQTRFNKKLEDYSNKLNWANGSGCDSIAILNAYKFWQHEREKGTLQKYDDEQKWCNKYGLDRKNLHEMRLLIFKIQDRLKIMNLEQLTGEKVVSWDTSEKPMIIKICIAGAFIPNYFIKGISDKETERSVYKSLVGQDPNRTVYFRKMDEKQIREVYIERIKHKFVEYGIANTTRGIKVSFDFSKVFVQFSGDDTCVDYGNESDSTFIPGSICNEIYKAVKFRKTGSNRTKSSSDDSYNTPFEIEVLHPDDTREYARSLGILEKINGEEKVKKFFYDCPEHIYLPSFNTKEMLGFVTYIEHCNKFYFQPVDDNSGVLSDIETSFKNEADFFEAKNLKVGKLVFALHQNFYKRAKIILVDHRTNTAECFMVDYGYTADIPFDQIFETDEDTMIEYFSISERCFVCRLAKITPSYKKCPRGKYTKEAVEEFRVKALGNFCKIVIYSFVENIAAVELFLGSQNFNEYMINQGYAKECDESYMSRLNHNERESVQMSLTPWLTREEEFKQTENNMIKVSIPSPPLDKCKKILKLDGPYSPLETQINAVSLKNTKTVQVDAHSVNNVVLDTELENYDGTLLVAAEVLTNQDKGFSLYNVTSMPNIHGLSTVLAMMFGINFIFYADDESTKYIGLRFGLGFHEKNLKAYHYDSDAFMPINYEEEFEDDIVNINYLRLLMCKLLTNESFAPELSDDQKHNYMRDIKSILIKLLSKQRKSAGNPQFCPDRTQYWKSNCGELVYMKDIHSAGPYPSIKLPPLKDD